MIAQQERSRPRAATWGWGILLALTAMLALNGVALYFFIAETGVVQTAAVLEIGLGLLALAVTWEGFRRGTRWAWNATWILVAMLAALGLHLLLGGGEAEVSAWYLALAAIALVGQLLAGRGLAR